MGNKTITVHGGYDDFLETLEKINNNKEEKIPLQLFLEQVEKKIGELVEHSNLAQKQIGELQEHALKLEKQIWELQDRQK
tara:strand:- start:576 stop:815 length:240 start_codon:yes stop_codon:yes gene_type:complete